MIVETGNKSEAISIVPPSLRSDAHIFQLESTPEKTERGGVFGSPVEQPARNTCCIAGLR
jgi:hypothetical protein